jgi:outer membrane protein assembly factor BamB
MDAGGGNPTAEHSSGRMGVNSKLRPLLGFLLLIVLVCGSGARASDSSDWPMWRYDAGRRALVEADLPDPPQLLWTRQLDPPKRAWPFQPEDYYTGGNPDRIGKLSFDVSYEPVVAAGKLFVPSMVSDRVTALSTSRGEELWRFYAEGPVRFAPVYDRGRIYFVSDDGYLYCVDSETGKLYWKFAGSYSNRRVLGNDRLISVWPARGAPVIKEGVVYFAAGIVAFEGIFVHAVDAITGEKIWTNSTSGSVWNLHQHGGAYSYGGPVPQGYLAVSGDKLLVPGGRTPPAVYDRHTGELLYFRQATGAVGKGAGGYRVFAHGEWFLNHGMLYALEDGAQYGPVPGAVLTDDAFIGARDGELVAHGTVLEKRAVEIEERSISIPAAAGLLGVAFAFLGLLTGLILRSFGVRGHARRTFVIVAACYVVALSLILLVGAPGRPDRGLRPPRVDVVDRLERGAIREVYELTPLWDGALGDVAELYFMSRNQMALSRNGGRTAALVAVSEAGIPDRILWEYEIDGDIWSILAGDGKLFVLDREGKIYCFGDGGSEEVPHHEFRPEVHRSGATDVDLARSIVREAGLTGGYAMVHGGAHGDLVKALIGQSEMHFVLVEPDANTVASLRRRFDAMGVYGRRVAVVHAEPIEYRFPPYIAELVLVSGGDCAEAQIEKAFDSLRPYGGTAVFTEPGENFAETFRRASPQGGELVLGAGRARVVRAGPLPGAGQWSHQYGSAANLTYSDDLLVKAPLGTLWFGGPSNQNVLPRHHNGPIPQVVGGRLFILGVDTISARCVYSGRELWVREIPGIGHRFTDLEYERRYWEGKEVYMPNHPGANFIGSPYVSTEDRVYLIHEDRLSSVDAATGAVLREFRLPPDGDGEIREYGHIVASGDLLILAVDPQFFDEGEPGKENNWNATSSTMLVVMNRHTGKVHWTKTAEIGFRHNAIVVGNRRVFLVDGLSEEVVQRLSRRGVEAPGSTLLALDLDTGEEVWRRDEGVFGTWLGYYEDKDILLQGGRYGQRRPLPDEPRDRLTAHRGQTGEIIWTYGQSYSGPLGLHPDMILPGRPGEYAIDPQTGAPIRRRHPITGEEYLWDYHRYYGCGTMNASRFLATFRSGAAGFADLLNFGGTGNLGGFRSGCTNNLVAADGVLNAPDYTRTCTCSYQLQTSFGLVHMPRAGVEMWTLNRLEFGNQVVRALGINFGAQGNRRENGVLWLEYPKVYGSGPDLPLEIASNAHRWFRNHATWIENPEDGYDWVASYGLMGVDALEVRLAPEGSGEARSYDVVLYFAEPDDAPAGARVFDVMIQGERVLESFDVSAQAGGPRRVVRRAFADVAVSDVLRVEFNGRLGEPVVSGVEIVLKE